MLQCWKLNEELNKGRDFKLQCSEGSVVAVLSEGVADLECDFPVIGVLLENVCEKCVHNFSFLHKVSF